MPMNRAPLRKLQKKWCVTAHGRSAHTLTGQDQFQRGSHAGSADLYDDVLCLQALPVTSNECAVSGFAFFPTARNAYVDPSMSEPRSATLSEASLATAANQQSRKLRFTTAT